MIITIDTNENKVEVLNEDTKDWEKGWVRSIQYTATVNEAITLELELILPMGSHLR